MWFVVSVEFGKPFKNFAQNEDWEINVYKCSMPADCTQHISFSLCYGHMELRRWELSGDCVNIFCLNLSVCVKTMLDRWSLSSGSAYTDKSVPWRGPTWALNAFEIGPIPQL